MKNLDPRIQAVSILAILLGVTVTDIEMALELLRQNQGYRMFTIPKRSGGLREINAPVPRVKALQKAILDRILHSFQIHFAVHGFERGRSIVTNAQVHMNFANAVFNMDLKDAFPTAQKIRVAKNIGWRLRHLLRQFTSDKAVFEHFLEITVELVTHNGCLPQGSPASPKLLNIACFHLDCEITEYLRQMEEVYTRPFRYSRYADDLTMSCPQEIPGQMKQELRRIIRRCGWKFNIKKIHDLSRFSGKTLHITGLNVVQGPDGADRLAIPTDRMNRYRAIMHHLTVHPPTDPQKLAVEQARIRGLINYVELVYGSKLPSAIKSTYLLCKNALSLQDRPVRSQHKRFDVYGDMAGLPEGFEPADEEDDDNLVEDLGKGQYE